MKRLLLTVALLLVTASIALAQGTQLNPPGVKWGSAGVQVPTPVQTIGYDSVSGLPCIVGSTQTCFYPGGSGVRELIPLAPMQRITSLSSAAALTVPTGSLCAVITADASTANVRWRDDGTNPTGTIGMELQSGATLPYCGTLSAISFIQEGTSPAAPALNVAFYK